MSKYAGLKMTIMRYAIPGMAVIALLVYASWINLMYKVISPSPPAKPAMSFNSDSF